MKRLLAVAPSLALLAAIAVDDTAHAAPRCWPEPTNTYQVGLVRAPERDVKFVHVVCAERKGDRLQAKVITRWSPAAAGPKLRFDRLALQVRLEHGKRTAAGDPDLYVKTCAKRFMRSVNRSATGEFVCATPWLRASKFPAGEKTADARLTWDFDGDGTKAVDARNLHGSPKV